MADGVREQASRLRAAPAAVAAPIEADSRVQAGMNLRAALLEGASRLHLVTDTPRLEAELLLAEAASLARTYVLAHPEITLSPEQLPVYRAYIARRSGGYPLPYVTGRAEFYGLEFMVTPDVLIPRPETELLVDLARDRRPKTVAEVGTGSGCVAVALALHLPSARIYATDLSGRALDVAAANARRYGVEDRIQFVQSDLAKPVRGPVDLVVSNPPYVAEAEVGSLPPSVQYEPRQAIDGGADGLDVIARLLTELPRLLGASPPSASGTALIEIGATQGRAAAALARSLLPEATVTVHPDLAGRDRALDVSGVRPCLLHAARWK